MTLISMKEQRNQVCLDIGRFFFKNDIVFNVASSLAFVNMLRFVGDYGHGFKGPSMHEMRTWILSLINFLVNNSYGKVFLKSIDVSNYIKDANLLFKLLDDIVEEVGEHLVVQVVADNASTYKAMGEKLMSKRKQLYWTPCAAHCLDLMLEKIGELPQHKTALLRAKKVSNYIHNHGWVLSPMRKFTKNEIVRPTVIRFVIAFLTLDSLHGMKEDFQRMYVSKNGQEVDGQIKLKGKKLRKSSWMIGYFGQV
ncbi:hypothetical protein UlMin_031566 [Ulmus minor]